LKPFIEHFRIIEPPKVAPTLRDAMLSSMQRHEGGAKAIKGNPESKSSKHMQADV
jgi:hypothetical protein